MSVIKTPFPYTVRNRYIFLSYARESADEARNIINKLQSDGYHVWFDEEMNSDKDRKEKILERIKNCTCFIALISPEFVNTNEIEYALELKKPVLLIFSPNLPPDRAGRFRGMLARYSGVGAIDYSDDEHFYKDLRGFVQTSMSFSYGPSSFLNEIHRSSSSSNVSSLEGNLNIRKDRSVEKTDNAIKNRKEADEFKKVFLSQMDLGTRVPSDKHSRNRSRGKKSYLSGEKANDHKKRQSSRETKKTTSEEKGNSVNKSPNKGRITTSEEADNTKNIPSISNVEFSAAVPRTVRRGEFALINIIMYEEEFRSEVDRYLNSGEKLKEVKSGKFNVLMNSKIKIELSSPSLKIEDSVEEGEWNGGYLNFSFFINVPDSYPNKQIPFIATVYINGLKATSLKFIVECESEENQQLILTREDILSAFVSYASQDRSRVAAIIQGMRKARPDLDLFFDVDSLRSGQNWEKALWNEIDKRDMLYLCWSSNAKSSVWVDREWHYALEHKGLEKIEPIPLDPPDQCPPPKELEKKHFNDRMLYFIQASKDFKV